MNFLDNFVIFIPYITVNMHKREEDVSLMKKYITENAGAGPGSTKPGYHTRTKNMDAGTRVNSTSLNYKVKDKVQPKMSPYISFSGI